MKNDKTIKNIIFDLRFINCILVVSCALALIFIILFSKNDIFNTDNAVDYSDLWSYESGSVVDFDDFNIDDHTSIHKRTNGEIINTMSLCFYSKNLYFTVFLDGEPIYDFHPQTYKFLGKAYGFYPHSITMPILHRDGDLRIEIDNLYSGKPGYIKCMQLDNSHQFLIDELQKSSYEFVLCFIVFIFGIVMIVIGILGKYFDDKRYEIMSLGAVAVITALWIASETQMLSILTCNPTATHFTDYMCLDIIGYPAVLFAAFLTGNKNTRLSIFIVITTLILLIGSFYSTIIGYKDYHELLIFTHINLLITALIIIYLMIVGFIKKQIKKKSTKFILFCFFVSLIPGIIDIIRYKTNSTQVYYVSFYKYSFLIFILLSGVYEFINIAEMSKNGKYAEIMEQLAYQDGLTGLLNRKAYNKKLNEALDKTHTYTFIMIDMNYLKVVNDQLGHLIGDKYIKDVAKYISASFINGESCFRIGGDEFFVLAEYPESDPLFSESLDSMMNKINNFNKDNNYPIPLSVAYGVTIFNPLTDEVELKVKEADEKMYEMKARMKAKIQINSTNNNDNNDNSSSIISNSIISNSIISNINNIETI